MRTMVCAPVLKLIMITTTFLFALSSVDCLGCDIAVVSAKATTNGRPIIWKSRDNSPSWHQEIKYFDAEILDPVGPGGYLMVYDKKALYEILTGFPEISSGGINESGFAITCTTVYENTNPIHEALNVNTDIVRQALRECTTISEFENILDNFDKYNTGKIISANFAVIDPYGGAALYEAFTGHIGAAIRPVMYEKYDANTGRITDHDGNVIDEGEGDNFIGFHNRANANKYIPWNNGEERRERATELLTQLSDEGRLDYRTIMQEVSKDIICVQSKEDSTEENYTTTKCISRAQTRLGLVIDGVAPPDQDENHAPELSTFWCALGEPAISVYVPYFVHAGDVSYLAYVDAIDIHGESYDLNDTCLMNRAMNRRETFDNLLYETNSGTPLLVMDDPTINKVELELIQEWTFPLEDFIIEKTEEFLEEIADSGVPVTTEALKCFSDYCNEFVYEKYHDASACDYDCYVASWDYDNICTN